tara:strand:+ start:902 stop:1171 length:270 start_codon:yes stop_codon:yes gene_type:complete
MIYDEGNYLYIEKHVGRRKAIFGCFITFFGLPKTFLRLLVEEFSMMFSILSLTVRMHTKQFRLAVKGKILHQVTLEEYKKINSEQINKQ